MTFDPLSLCNVYLHIRQGTGTSTPYQHRKMLTSLNSIEHIGDLIPIPSGAFRSC